MIVNKILRNKMLEYAKLKKKSNELLDEILNELEDQLGEEKIEQLRGLKSTPLLLNFHYASPLTEFENQSEGGIDIDLLIKDIELIGKK